MPQFSVNTNRYDPYKNFRFRVTWDNRYVPGISKISCLKRSTDPVVHREGNDPSISRLSPGTWRFDPITLERGITHDNAFEEWANLSFQISSPMSLKNFRKDITIELLNEQGTVVKAFRVYRCWVSEYQVLPILEANAGSVAMETITLENEGWERDTSLSEPSET
jgi:phage tail-like protein